jgi:hypothetical protein
MDGGSRLTPHLGTTSTGGLGIGVCIAHSDTHAQRPANGHLQPSGSV